MLKELESTSVTHLTLPAKEIRIPSVKKTMQFEARAKKSIKSIPRGKVATYAQVAALAGNYRAARQVVRVLHASSEKDRLPWHRVISSRGSISLARGRGFEEQKRLLLQEGVRVSRFGRVDLEIFRWEPEAPGSRAACQFLRSLSRE